MFDESDRSRHILDLHVSWCVAALLLLVENCAMCLARIFFRRSPSSSTDIISHSPSISWRINGCCASSVRLNCMSMVYMEESPWNRKSCCNSDGSIPPSTIKFFAREEFFCSSFSARSRCRSTMPMWIIPCSAKHKSFNHKERKDTIPG